MRLVMSSEIHAAGLDCLSFSLGLDGKCIAHGTDGIPVNLHNHQIRLLVCFGQQNAERGFEVRLGFLLLSFRRSGLYILRRDWARLCRYGLLSGPAKLRIGIWKTLMSFWML